MVLKGIKRGDTDFRHFTFDDQDTLVKNGETYYKVNYGKNKLEGPDAEDEIGYLTYDQIMVLGGKKFEPAGVKPVQTSTPKTKQVPETESAPKKKPGRPKKASALPDVVSDKPEETGTFEYLVEEIKSDDATVLQEQLNKYGGQGWELCGFDTNKSLFGEIHIIVIFKRKRG